MLTLNDYCEAANNTNTTCFSFEDVTALENLVGTPVNKEGVGDDIAQIRSGLQAELNKHYWQYMGQTLPFRSSAGSVNFEKNSYNSEYKHKMETIVSCADKIISILGIEYTARDGTSNGGEIPFQHCFGYGIFNLDRKYLIYNEFIALSDSVYELRRMAQDKVNLIEANDTAGRAPRRDPAKEELYLNLRNAYVNWWNAKPTVSVNRRHKTGIEGGPFVRFMQFCLGKILQIEIKAYTVKDTLRSIDKN